MIVEPLKMLCAEAVDALAPRAKDLNFAEPLRLMYIFKKLNLSLI